MEFLYDIVNLEFVVIISFLVVAYYLKSEPLKVFLLFGHVLVIFLLNDVLFSPSYFGDQMRQTYTAEAIRSGKMGMILDEFGTKMVYSSLIYALFPFPFINSIQSVAMINFLIYLLLFVLMMKNNMSNNSVVYFYLLFPSLLLYSSLALRDTLVLLFLFFGTFLLLIKEMNCLLKYTFTLLVLWPLLVFKPQNYYMFIVALALFFYFRNAGKLRYGIFILIVIIGSFVPEKVPIVGQVYERLEVWRLALYHDHYEYRWDMIEKFNLMDQYEPLGTGFFLLYQIAKYFFYMLLKPFPWECTNPFQLIQSIENIVILGMIIWMNKQIIINEKIKLKILFLNCLLFVSMTINGIVVYNFGTAVRYKFPFIVVYCVFYLYFIKCDESLRYKNSSRILSSLVPRSISG